MKLATFGHAGTTGIGVVLGEEIVDLEDAAPSLPREMTAFLAAGAEALEKTIEELKKQDDRFHMEGGSWTNNISWVRGYEHLLGPMQKVSALFAEKILAQNVPNTDPRYRSALYHLMLTQTSCFRYWGKGIWTDYGRELCRRTMEILKHDF